MDSTPAPARSRLHVGSALRFHLASIVVLGLLGLLAGAAVSLLAPREYTATTSVLLQPLEANPYSPTAQGSDLATLETETQLVASDVVADAVTTELESDFPDLEGVSDGLDVTVLPNTQILQISYTGSDRELVEEVSAQYAQSYLDYRAERRDDFVQGRLDGLRGRIRSLAARIGKLRDRGFGNDAPEVRALGGQLLNLRLQEAALQTGSSPGEVTAMPTARAAGLALPPGLAPVAGLVMGLLVGIAVALLRERRAGVLRTLDDIEDLGLPVLGRHGLGEGDTTSDVAAMAGTLLNRRSSTPATVSVSPVSAPVAVNGFSRDLAGVLVQGRDHVLLIDGAGRGPSTGPGLSETLAGSQPLDAGLERTESGVAHLPAGHDPAQAAQLFATSRMTDLLEAAGALYEWVIVEGPRADSTSGRAVVGACRYWIPVVSLGVTSRDHLERGLAWARAAGAEPLGVVVVEGAGARRRRR